jgi:hypothetical protein
MSKIVVRILGGIGNQLFCYAAARRLAIVNDAELVIDSVSGFAYDYVYRRKCQLHHFSIPCREATLSERLWPFSRLRRFLKKWANHFKPFDKRTYIKQRGTDFDPRILKLKTCGKTVYLDGYWQSESYFEDVKDTIRDDLRVIPPVDATNKEMAARINNCMAIAVHFRFFDPPGVAGQHNISASYYKRAIDLIESRIYSPHYFLFSDHPEIAKAMITIPKARITVISHNKGDENAYADLWLMTQCKHFIIANSTFSWWGAWLGERADTMVIAPNIVIRGITSWGFKGLIPERWLLI